MAHLVGITFARYEMNGSENVNNNSTQNTRKKKKFNIN
jgi:hypothetical protein